MESLTALQNLIAQKRGTWLELASDIWNNPELGFEERHACARQTTLLKELGFDVEVPFAGLETAYKGTRGGAGPVFCFVAEYDALPGLGHGCGHNLICTAALAAGWATAELLAQRDLPGRVVVMGTPAEESRGGKVLMLREKALDGVDAVMMVHPSWRTTPDMGALAIRSFEIVFHGKEAHASGSPDLGLNALDGVMLFFAGINAWRQQMPAEARVHGIVTDGGEAPNIIPGRAACRFFLRHPEEGVLDTMERRFRDIAHGAELMTGTTAEIVQCDQPYRARRPNRRMNSLYFTAAEAVGLTPVIPTDLRRGSSDFGDFSQVIPGIHPYFGIAQREIAGHSSELAAAAGSDYGKEQMLKAAAAMGQVGYQFLADPSFRGEVLADFGSSS